MFLIYIKEAWMNVTENKRTLLSFVIFLSTSLIGIIITDSLIYSVSKKAEDELKTYGDNILTVNFHFGTTISHVREVLSGISNSLSFSKDTVLTGGESPHSSDSISVTGIDDKGVKINNIIVNNKDFTGNVAALNNNSITPINNQLYLNGVPFNISAKKSNIKNDFLNSLGISGFRSHIQLIIPLTTLSRLTLDTDINSVKIILPHDVAENDVTQVRNALRKSYSNKYDIITSLDARETVRNVFSRFSLLINAIYTILLISAITTSIILCKRNFASRKIEFSLKIIHGIDKKTIIRIVVIEAIYILLFCSIISMVFSSMIMYAMQKIMLIELMIRSTMVLVALVNIIIICIISCVKYGNSFFKKNPVSLING
ncbi:permease [Salmonella enterica subsp. enterica serovar Bovismorbificans]|nr:permease [Salmonella enterica subsp. enterica serovar Bovismorbificans]